MQEEEEGVPGEIPCRMRKRVSCWNTTQVEGEAVLVKYHSGRGRGCSW
jgi:hypothetical protein